MVFHYGIIDKDFININYLMIEKNMLKNIIGGKLFINIKIIYIYIY